MPAQKTKTIASTQHHLDIYTIQDNLVILKDGGAVLVLQVSAVNFGLLAESEQDALIYAYAGLINSLSFPIQIMVRSQKKDVSSYLRSLAEAEKAQKSNTIKQRIKNYRQFVEKTVRDNEVLDKKFYIVVPFTSFELGATKSVTSALKKSPQKPPYPLDYILKKAKTSLFPKKDHLLRQLNRLGLKAKQLETQDLIELYYHIYNPETPDTQEFSDAKEYNSPIVSAGIQKSKDKNG